MDYPKLLWTPDGVEVTVQSPDEEAARVAEGYRRTATAAPAVASTEGQALDDEDPPPRKAGKHK